MPLFFNAKSLAAPRNITKHKFSNAMTATDQKKKHQPTNEIIAECKYTIPLATHAAPNCWLWLKLTPEKKPFLIRAFTLIWKCFLFVFTICVIWFGAGTKESLSPRKFCVNLCTVPAVDYYYMVTAVPSIFIICNFNKPYYYISIIVYVWEMLIYECGSWHFFVFLFCHRLLVLISHVDMFFFHSAYILLLLLLVFFVCCTVVLIWHYLVSHSMWDFFCIYV